MTKNRLVITQILAWADEHHARTGSWPRSSSGRIQGGHGETWQKVDDALRNRARGLPGGSSLSRVLAEQRGAVPYARISRRWDEQLILTYADAYHARTGRWPRNTSGMIPDTGGIKWSQLDRALELGTDGLPGRSSLARLLAKQRGAVR
jgi:hypothetical protein